MNSILVKYRCGHEETITSDTNIYQCGGVCLWCNYSEKYLSPRYPVDLKYIKDTDIVINYDCDHHVINSLNNELSGICQKCYFDDLKKCKQCNGVSSTLNKCRWCSCYICNKCINNNRCTCGSYF